MSRRLKEKNLYLDIASRVARESYAQRSKVGAVFVSEDGIISIGYNGTPSGWNNLCEDKEYMDLSKDNYDDYPLFNEIGIPYRLVTKPEVAHAEENVFSKIMRQGLSTKNGVLYLTLSPCFSCAKMIHNAGIREVYFKDEYRITDGVQYLKEAGVYVERVEMGDNRFSIW